MFKGSNIRIVRHTIVHLLKRLKYYMNDRKKGTRKNKKEHLIIPFNG